MSITTYTELKTAVENWLDHTLFTARVPEFIALFEATANRRLRVQQQETQGPALIPSAVNGSVLLPADYLAWRHVTWQGTPTVELNYVARPHISKRPIRPWRRASRPLSPSRAWHSKSAP